MERCPWQCAFVEITRGPLTHAGAPSKAQRIHLRHVVRQFRGLEKRVAALLLQHTPRFLALLERIGNACGSGAPDLALPFCLLLERQDGAPLMPADVWPVRLSGR